VGKRKKNVEKLKKKRQKVFKSRKKRKKRRKIEKNDAKRCAICGVFSKSGNISSCVARRAYCVGEMMLEGEKNVKMGKFGNIGNFERSFRSTAALHSPG